jgi:sugar phosphate isomerase/epimerase
MKIGVSTASLFLREYNEDAIVKLNELGIETTEIFLASYSEYTHSFAKLLKKNKGNIDVHSIHVLNTQYEPQLYTNHLRAKTDAFCCLENVMKTAKMLGAKYYTFHGIARLKKVPIVSNYDIIGEKTNQIIDMCEKYNVSLAYENVHWAYYNYAGFFSELKKRCPKLKGVLDIKQARQSEIDYSEYIKDMTCNIVTVHLSDINENGKIVLPGKGIFDFVALFKQLKDNGFDGALLIEVYKDDYKDVIELKQSTDFVKELTYKIF